MSRWFPRIIGFILGLVLILTVLALLPQRAHAAALHGAPLAACAARWHARYPADDPGPRPADTIPWTTGDGQVIRLTNAEEVQRWEDRMRTRDVVAENAIDHYCHGLNNGVGEPLTGRTVIVETGDALIPVTIY